MKHLRTVFAVLIIAAVCAAWFVLGGNSPLKPSLAESEISIVEIRLASRTIKMAVGGGRSVSFPAAPRSVKSSRGTAPFVLVAPGRATKNARMRAESCGAEILGVVAPYGLIVEADADSLRRLRNDGLFSAAVEMLPEDKMASSLEERFSGEDADGRVMVNVLTVRPEDAEVVAELLKQRGFAVKDVQSSRRGRVRAEVDATMLDELAVRGDVRWIECYHPARLMNDVVVGSGLMNVSMARGNYGLTGKGQTITVSDTGLDTGNIDTMMADFRDRVATVHTMSGAYSEDIQGHGTHVAGSLVGSGELSGEGRPLKGIAPEAKLNVWQCLFSDGKLYFPDWDSLFQPSRDTSPSYIHSASWGCSSASEYTSACEEVDEWMWNNPEYLGVFAAGNSGDAGTISDPGGAKNTLCVGGTESYRPDKGTYCDNPSSIAYFSSKGPMKDGRVKPDVCSPGTFILSTFSSIARSMGKVNLGWTTYSDSSDYTYCGGTSMATPLTAGAAALVRQWLMESRGYTNSLPTAALIKAVIMGGAHDMSGDDGASCGGLAPNNSQGWGRVDVGGALYPSGRQIKLVDRIPFFDGAVNRVRVTVTNSAPFSAQLVWTDYPGDAAAQLALVNDLDLVVSNELTGAVWYGNGVQGGDRTNNVESVRIALAEAATYSVFVKGSSVLYDSGEGGAAALYVCGAFSEEDDEQDRQTVTLTVAVSGDETGTVSPAIGVHTVDKGSTMLLKADDWMGDANVFGTVSMKRAVAGWSGEGDVPASGEGDSVVVTLERDSSVVWRWADSRDFLLRAYSLVNSYGAYYWEKDEYWLKEGGRMDFSIPYSVPGGVEIVDLSSLGLTYTDDDGSEKPMTVQRLGRIEIAETDASDGEVLTDASGYMAEEFSIVMERPMDILFSFWDTASTNVTCNLPNWWYYRYVADNPAADDVRFTSVSPQMLEWVGGSARTLLLERAEKLGVEEDWKTVHTADPEAVLTNRWQIPVEYSTNSFYRIRGS